MLTRWYDIENAVALMDEYRRRLNRYFDTQEERYYPTYGEGFFTDEWLGGWPRTKVIDTGSNILVRAELPGLGEDAIKLTVHQEVLTLSGERPVEVPEGYSVHRQERRPVKFSRSFSLGCKVDLERVTAVMKNGLLTITLPKAPESQPRQISVKVH